MESYHHAMTPGRDEVTQDPKYLSWIQRYGPVGESNLMGSSWELSVEHVRWLGGFFNVYPDDRQPWCLADGGVSGSPALPSHLVCETRPIHFHVERGGTLACASQTDWLVGLAWRAHSIAS